MASTIVTFGLLLYFILLDTLAGEIAGKMRIGNGELRQSDAGLHPEQKPQHPKKKYKRFSLQLTD